MLKLIEPGTNFNKNVPPTLSYNMLYDPNDVSYGGGGQKFLKVGEFIK